MNTRFALTLITACCLAFTAAADSFKQSDGTVDRYEFVEVTLRLDSPATGNPFTDATLTGKLSPEGAATLLVDGFCDSDDGRTFRIRFMPTAAGEHRYVIHFRNGSKQLMHAGQFNARRGSRKGLVRVDPQHPFHFVWEGTGEHYFWNSTTAYALIGWRDEAVIRETIDRLAKLGINRARAAIVPPRVRGGLQWKEPAITNDAHFTFCVNAWPAARPDSVDDPGFDVSRFNVTHWQKFERLLAHAQSRDLVISVIFYVDGRLPGVDPFKTEGAGGEAEKRYYRYAAARLAPFANVMWDVANEYRLFRDDAWAEKMGAFLRECDPYDHLTSIHGHGDFRFRKSAWADYAMFQSWDESGGYDYMLKNRREQSEAGRPIPQVNEEYGYEDHYPFPWGQSRRWPARTADNRRRLAWEMTMAGTYQTTGERADIAGLGGWINGRGNEHMTMLGGYAHLRKFFEELEWWKLEARPDLLVIPPGPSTEANPREKIVPPTPSLKGEPMLLAQPGARYVIYLPRGGTVTVKLDGASYRARWINPRTGEVAGKAGLARGQWTSPLSPDAEDWVLLLEVKD